jgi:DNA mismatch repair protein MutS2
MQPAALRALEFDRVREALSRAAFTPLGRVRAAALEPASEPDAVAEALALTLEAAAFAREGGSLGLAIPEDLPMTVGALAVAGEPLEPLRLRGLAQALDSIATVVAAIARTTAADRARLRAVAAPASSFEMETAAVSLAIDPSGDVTDAASPLLRETRAALRRHRAKLRATLDSLLQAKDSSKYLQDQIVTDRHGRYVVVLRAEHRHAVPGIVHGGSASGASLYVEPLATVELNNDIVALVEREKAEVHRILLELTESFRARTDDLEQTLDVAADLDLLHAKIDLARRVDGVAPDLTSDGRLEWRGARHPLLIPAFADLLSHSDARVRHAAAPVPSDLILVPPESVLVISGPNTGGKTVALKAAGLLALMAQSGLLVPVEPGSRFTPFRTIFADIGDEQSISASLSTFSAHVARLVAMERVLALPALVLLDEVGSGTDPVEGGALGTAVVEHFRKRGAIVIATTHDDSLKSYAATTTGVRTAGFGFNPDTYAPTYRLIHGAPGRSLALEIADRLGMPAAVIADARARLSGRESQLAAHLTRLDRELAAVERERQSLAADRQAVQEDRAKLLQQESRLAEREAVLKRRLDDRVNERLREARGEVDRIVGTLKQKAESLAEQAERQAAKAVISTGELGRLRRDAREALSALEPAPTAAPGTAAPLEGPPVEGQPVYVPAFQTEGVVRGLSGKYADVDVRGKRMKVKVAELRQPVSGAHPSSASDGRSGRAAGRVAVTTASREGASSRELVLVGATVDDALGRAEKFLDDALLADERRLRVVHGYGTGRLREALTKFFREHPLVASVSRAPDQDGGGAATIVELKD